MPFFQRNIYKTLLEHLKTPQVLVLTGIRRTGKTTLIKKLLEDFPGDNKLYIDLERIDNRELFTEKNYENVILTLKQRGLDFGQQVCLALDEIQLVPNLPSVLKYLYDNYNIKFLITGSSSFYLKNLFSESLAGRKKIFELYPLSFGEFLSFKNIIQQPNDWQKQKLQSAEYERLKGYYEEYIKFGGFPEVVLAQTVDQKKDLLADILTSYINIDIKLLADFRKQDELYNLIKLLASRVGNKIEVANLAGALNLSRHTVENYLKFFEQTYLLKRIRVYSKSGDRQSVKARKLYFVDTGLVNILADIHSGAQLENTIFCQLSHYGELEYYSRRSGLEIDFILNSKIALEVKETPTLTDQKQLADLAKKISINNFHIISRYPPTQDVDFVWGGLIR